MGISKEFFCPGHGSFESDAPRCPHGCSITPEREFLTAPAVHSGVAKRTDALVRSQVEALGLSNIRSSREGETARIQSPAEQRAVEFQKAVRKKFPSPWGAVPKGGTFHATNGPIEAKPGQGAQAALAAHHAEPNAIDKGLLEANKRRTEYVRDPDNLKLDVSKAA